MSSILYTLVYYPLPDLLPLPRSACWTGPSASQSHLFVPERSFLLVPAPMDWFQSGTCSDRFKGPDSGPATKEFLRRIGVRASCHRYMSMHVYAYFHVNFPYRMGSDWQSFESFEKELNILSSSTFEGCFWRFTITSLILLSIYVDV